MEKQQVMRVEVNLRTGQYLYLQMEILWLLELTGMMEMVLMLVMFVFMKILEAHGLK